MKRALIFGTPLVALGLAGWSAWQVQRHLPGLAGDAARPVIMMLPESAPGLNPFLPASEAERQMLDLLHEPLIRLDSQGRLAPGLAESWAWHQHLTCWFSTAEAHQDAQRQLAELPGSTRQAWELEDVTADGLSLVLRFARPGAEGTDAALQAIASESLLPLSFLRIASLPAARAVMEEFAADPTAGMGTVRLWFDEDGHCELVSTRPLLQLRESLTSWLQQKGQPIPRMTPLAEVAGLLEPVLDFKLSPSRPSWSDGTPVTAADVKATVALVRQMGLPVQGQEGFRHIQSIAPVGNEAVRVTYRRNYGTALASWIGFPILPEAWLNQHPYGSDFSPPGAGQWQVQRDGRNLALAPRAATTEETPPLGRLQTISSTSSLQARVALATGTLDIVWPGDASEWQKEPSLDFHTTPPQNRLLVLWNLRSSRLSELPVREALSLGLNRQALLPEGTAEDARPAEPLFRPHLWYSPASSASAEDLRLATQKLEAAGWVKDVSGIAKKGGQALEFELLVTTGNARRSELAEHFVRQWEALGARTNVKFVSQEELVPDHLAPGKFDAVLLGMDYELGWDRTAFWHSGQIKNGLNFSQLSDPQLDLLLETLAAEFDTRQLPARAQAVQDRLMSMHPVLPLIGDQQRMGVRKGRFPDLPPPNSTPPLTLRSLLTPDASGSLKMRLPNE